MKPFTAARVGDIQSPCHRMSGEKQINPKFE